MFFKDSVLISLRNFNQLDAALKVMYRHDCFGTLQWLPHSGHFLNKANGIL